MSRIAQAVLISSLAIVLAFAAGNATGLYFYPLLFDTAHEDDHDQELEAAADDEHEHEEHLALTRQAFENLELQLGTLVRGEFWKSISVPGEVTEIPGKSDLSVSAPIAGIIEQVEVLEGQALGPADHLFTLSITDDALANAQSKLLATMSREEVLRKEIARVTPLTESGTLSGSRLRELEYELNQLEATQETLKQELLGRGLPQAVLEQVVADKSLATEIRVQVPAFLELPVAGTTPVALGASAREKDFSIEQLQVHPGQSVQRGDTLCRLAYHAELYIEGQAFEGDSAALAAALDRDWGLTAEFGHEHHSGHSHTFVLNDLRVLHVDNRINRETQTSRFYLPLANEVVRSITDKRGGTFQQWRFRPGQRVHLKLPVEHWQDKLLVPVDAVVIDGPDAFLFAEHIEEEEEEVEEGVKVKVEEEEDEEHEDVFIELEPVPVRLYHRDNRVAVIDESDRLPSDQRVALNAAYKLHLALQRQAAGGGGHHHHHDH